MIFNQVLWNFQYTHAPKKTLLLTNHQLQPLLCSQLWFLSSTMPKSKQSGSGASRIRGNYWQCKNYSLAGCTVGTELLCHLSSIRRTLNAEPQEKKQAVRTLLKDCPENGAGKAQPQRRSKPSSWNSHWPPCCAATRPHLGGAAAQLHL